MCNTAHMYTEAYYTPLGKIIGIEFVLIFTISLNHRTFSVMD